MLTDTIMDINLLPRRDAAMAAIHPGGGGLSSVLPVATST